MNNRKTIHLAGYPSTFGVVAADDGTTFQTTTVGGYPERVTHVTVIDPADPENYTTITVPGSPWLDPVDGLPSGVVKSADGVVYQLTIDFETGLNHTCGNRLCAARFRVAGFDSRDLDVEGGADGQGGGGARQQEADRCY